jgi:predicted Rossmann-fold nucleotide-binding protein
LEIWSGGQTGVDRAALDAALELGYAIGGWIPKGRHAEDGTVPLDYAALQEAVTADYDERTRLNVRDTDATLVMSWGEPGGGTRETSRIARELGRPLLITDLDNLWTRLDGSGNLLINVSGPTQLFAAVFARSEQGDVGVYNLQASFSPVPLPAAGWLLLSGLGALGALRRKSAAKSSAATA